jgi:hypothetical protein
MSKKSTILVIAGLDTDQRPHAARFPAKEKDAVNKAAALMGFQIGIATTTAGHRAAAKIAKGRLFGTGRALVPFVKDDVFTELTSDIAFQPPSQVPQPDEPQHGLFVGKVVLCHDAVNLGWWEAFVVELEPSDARATLRWRDYPKFKPFTCSFSEIAVIGEAVVNEAASS